MQMVDAIVVGSGACGGWATMALAQAGMKVLLVEAGSAVSPAKEFHHRWPYELPFRGRGQPGLLQKYFRGSNEYNYRIMIDDRENPYTTPADKPFRWSRARVLGGRTLHWSRASDRMSDLEFKAASRDGYGDNWPISYTEIAPYYDRVESFIGVSGASAGLPQFPDGKFLPAMPLNCAETMFDAACRKIGLPATPRRVAQLTRMLNNRPPCHYCGNCGHGCDVGAMFNTVAVTLPPALRTKNVTVRCDSVVSHVLMNAENRARGVAYIERHTQEISRGGGAGGDPGRLGARKHTATAELAEGRSGELKRRAGALPDGSDQRLRRDRIPAGLERHGDSQRRWQS
jgi:choline dehydrogenase-like flavoprotein